MNVLRLAFHSKGIYYSPINMKTPRVVWKSTVCEYISFSNVTTGLHDVSVNCTNYNDNNTVAIDFSNNNSSYIY